MVNALYHDERGKFKKGGPGGPGRAVLERTYTRAKLIETLADNRYDPIMAMIHLAQDPDSSNYLKFEIAKEIASYLLPKQKAVQLQDPDGTPATLTIKWDVEQTPAQQAANGVENALTTIVEAVVDDEDER